MQARERQFDIDLQARWGADPAAPWPVDHAHLRRYTMGDRQLEREILGLFAGDLPKSLMALRAAGSEQDWKMASHTLKGSARAVGAWRVARAVAAAEQQPAAITDPGLKDQMLRAIDEAVIEVAGYILSLDSPA